MHRWNGKKNVYLSLIWGILDEINQIYPAFAKGRKHYAQIVEDCFIERPFKCKHELLGT